MKLNLGCARDVREGWVNVDMYYDHPLVTKADILSLDYEKGSVDYILAKDIIEHLPYEVAMQNLRKWYDWLQDGGELFIQTTNFDQIIEAYKKGIWELPVLNHMLFAGVNYTNVGSQECDFHKSVYSQDFLINELKKIGYSIVSVAEDDIDSVLISHPKSHNLNLEITVKK